MLINNFTLLYVEDDREAQEQMKILLQDDVKEFYRAYDGEEGLAVYEEKNPDIILTDITMPLLDGLDMAQEIKNRDRDKPIMIMSAFDDRKTLLRAINIGVDYFVLKPIDITIVYEQLNKIAKILQNRLDASSIRKKEIESLYQLAHYDTLTNIPNRFLFDLRVEQALSKAKREKSVVTLFFIDLDNFKNINDTYSHAGGDVVLHSLAKNIQNIIRKEDTFARISGDEFALLVEGIGDKQALDDFAKKILKASSTAIKYENFTIKITCSIGISSYPQDTTSQKELIHFADVAMYSAKKAGKGKYFYF